MIQKNTSFTLEDFRKALEALAVNRPPERQLVLYTGIEGMRNIDYAFGAAKALEEVAFLKEKKVLTEAEGQRLEDMITSSDHENFEIAKSVIQEKSEFFYTQPKKHQEQCLYNSKPAITVTQVPTL
jgi:hypothetical protein